MGKTFGYAGFIALILALCLIPSLGMLVSEPEEAGANEVLALMPELQDTEGNWNEEYLVQLKDYAEDHFFLRQSMISAWSALNVDLLHTSISDSVILGRDGWLYYEGTLNDYTGTDLLSQREVASAARNLALVKEYCESQGARFLFTTTPNKNSLYPEHMPSITVFSQERNADRLAVALEGQGVAYLDLFSTIGGEDETLYFTQDSHWNSKGAALGADAINAALGRTSSYYAGPFNAQAVHLSDLYEMLFPTGTWLEDDQVYGGELVFEYEAPIRSAENITIMTTKDGEGSLLMFRDSFGNLLYPYLADSFGSALFSRSTDYRLDFVAQRATDYVVVELVERNLNYLVENVPQMPAPWRETPAAATSGGSVALTVEPSEYVLGCVQVSGVLPEEPDTDSIVYLRTGEDCYEAFQLTEGRFTLFVPKTALVAGEMSVLFEVNGAWTAVSAVQS